MLGQLYVVPFTNTLVLAKSKEDANTLVEGRLTFIRDVPEDAVKVNKQNKEIRLKRDYLGKSLVSATYEIKRELECL